MLLIDMPMPDNCGNCPCSYMILTGEHSGELMCCAMEWKFVCKMGDSVTEFQQEWVVSCNGKRPARCPIKGEIEDA